MEKGLGIIVARQDKNGLHTDTICDCDASFFSILTPIVLQKADLKSVSPDKILYICGHGNKKKRTISGYTMTQLAQLFVEAGYTGNQKIVLASCHSSRKKHGRTMAEDLSMALAKLNIIAECESIATGISLVWEKSYEVECQSLPYKRGQNVAFMTLQKALFRGGESVSPDKDAVRRDIKENADDVQKWNSMAIDGAFNIPVLLASNLGKCFKAACVTLFYVLLFLAVGIRTVPTLTFNYFVFTWLSAEILMLLEIPYIGAFLLSIAFFCGLNWFIAVRTVTGLIAFLISFFIGVLKKFSQTQ